MFNSMALANAKKNAGSDLSHIIEVTPSQPTNVRMLKEAPRANTVISEARSKCQSFLGLEELAKLKKIRDYERFLRDHKMIENIMDSQRSKFEEQEQLSQRVFPRNMADPKGKRKDKLLLDLENKVAKFSSRNERMDLSGDVDMNISEI